ncbi:hypothetical protein LSTR_LSTR016108 [Laodelphax striatellus]|uniref:PAP-associated domain-containing protein n=1 Tax=Laodelphax striatellus TaxID=195883 RepID=A0A482WM74_LAOST|nr:hypothetical protein LSTR_LSTR016108 [Laodelphax striatellus]
MFCKGWDCRYSSTFNPKMRELPDVYDLVKIFFEFYSDLRNFDRKVLAPLTAEKFDHQRIRQKKLPPAYGRYCHLISTKTVRFFKLTNGLCLQDPLQLNYNLTNSLQGNNLNKFVAYCKETLKCFH